MMLPVVLLLTCAATSTVWVENSLEDTAPGRRVSGRSQDTARLWVLRGESESFQVVVQAGRSPIEGLRLVRGVEAATVSQSRPTRRGKRQAVADEKAAPTLPPPAVYVIEPVALRPPAKTDTGEGSLVYDRLRPFEQATVPARESLRLWVTFAIPHEARPGLHLTELCFGRDHGPALRVPVRIEVFDAVLDESPVLPVIAPLNFSEIQRVFGAHAPRLEECIAFLARYRVSPLLWDDGALFTGPDAIQRLAAVWPALEAARPAVIDLGGYALTPALFRTRAGGGTAAQVQDWLAERGALAQVQAQYWLPDDRLMWSGFRAMLDRHAADAPGIARMIVGPPRPELAGVAERWALPYECVAAGAAQALARGAWVDVPVRRPRYANATGMQRIGGVPTNAMDAFDGALMTAWSAQAQRDGDHFYLEAEWRDPITTRTLQIAWDFGLAAPELQVKTSFDGRFYADASVAWAKPQPAVHGRTISQGRFKYETTFTALRLRLGGLKAGNVVRIAEVLADAAAERLIPPPDLPAEPWLSLEESGWPAPALTSPLIGARLLGALCWAYGLRGMLLPEILAWPAGASASGWPEAVHAAQLPLMLAYPSEAGLLPSVRLERLRDAVEDYGCYALLARAMSEGRLHPATGAKLIPFRDWPAWMTHRELEAMAEGVLASHQAIGSVLSGVFTQER
jgi:hypothetical protein